MFRTTNEEPSEHQPYIVHAFAPEESFDLRPKLFAGGATNAAAQGSYLRGGLPPWVVRRCESISKAILNGESSAQLFYRYGNRSGASADLS